MHGLVGAREGGCKAEWEGKKMGGSKEERVQGSVGWRKVGRVHGYVRARKRVSKAEWESKRCGGCTGCWEKGCKADMEGGPERGR